MSYFLAFIAGFFTRTLIKFLLKLNTEKDLSVRKPVKEFVKTFKENPDRFELDCVLLTKEGCQKFSGIAGNFNANFCRDTRTGEVFEFAFSGTDYDDLVDIDSGFYISKPAYITSDEEKYIQQELFMYYIKRSKRLQELRKLRERKRHMRTYCN